MLSSLHYPLAGRFRISQAFGARYLYFGKAQVHQGLDFACPKGTPVLAAHAGRVSLARLDESERGYGNELRIATDEGYTQYAHLDSFSVQLDDRVEAGEIIGYAGNSGFTLGENGEHLHFGCFRAGRFVDPAPLLDFADGKGTEERSHAGLRSVKIYIVKPSDTLAQIAQRYYGSSTEWTKIFAENNHFLRDANKIRAGQKLILPDL